MNRSEFADEYNFQSIVQIDTGYFPMFVTPRYEYFYSDRRYEPFSVQLVTKYLRSVDRPRFVDAGAHYGYFSLLAHQANPRVKIIAIEPVPENVRLIKENIALNRIKDIVVYQAAASNLAGVKEFNLTEASNSAGFYEHPLTATAQTIQVHTKTLDSIIGSSKIDMIKIDVEGHESAVLDGLAHTIQRSKQLVLLLEFCPDLQRNAGVKPRDFLQKILDLGLQIYVADEANGSLYPLKDPSIWSHYLHGQITINLICVKGDLPFSKRLVKRHPESSDDLAKRVTDLANNIDRRDQLLMERQVELVELRRRVKEITGAKFFRLWQTYCLIRDGLLTRLRNN